MARGEAVHHPEASLGGAPQVWRTSQSPRPLLARWWTRRRPFTCFSRSERQRARGRSRSLLLLACAILLLAGLAVGRSPVVTTLSGTFELAPGSLPPQTTGGSELSVQDDGRSANLTLWTAPGVPTYFVPALLFVVHASSALQGGSAHGSLAVALSSTRASLPVGEELYALVEPYAPSTSCELAATSLVPGGELRAPAQAHRTSYASPFEGIFWGMDVSGAGVQWVGSTMSVSFVLPAGGEASLALVVGLVLSAGALEASQASFTLTITLSSPTL